jgi:hypothetical protein
MIADRSMRPAGVRQIGLFFASAFLIGIAPMAFAGAQAPPDQTASFEKPFLAENDAAMDKMMSDMTIQPSGDVDRDFVAMMVPHHQGAVDMAQAELRYGHNEQLRRIAQEIIVDQLQEIAAMRLALGQPLPPSVASPTQPAPASPSNEHSTSHGATTMSHTMMHQEH